MGVALLRVVVTFAIAWGVSRFARELLEPRIARQKHGRDGAMLTGRLISIAAYVIAFISVMNQLGVNWTGVLALLSAFTVAIGLSLQDVIRNFFSGILLLLERPFSVGDRVRVRDFEGEVQGIDVRTTLIRNQDGALIHVPNAIMFSEILTNRSHFRTRRFHVTIKDPERGIDQIEHIVQSALKVLPEVRKPIAGPKIMSLSPDNVVVHYSFLVQAKPDVEHAMMLALQQGLDGATIEVKE